MFNAGIMIIACPACATRYVVPDQAIGVDGRTVRCAKCRHSWFQEGARLDRPEPAAPAAPAMPTGERPAPAEPVARPAPLPREPLDDEPLPPPPPPLARPAPAVDEAQSQFDHEPPFRPRRNPARMWTIAAALFAVVALGAVAAAAWYGLPSWLSFSQPMFAAEQAGLKLDFPEKRQGPRQLPDQTWFFEANGTVTNISQDSRSVPPILVVLRDARDRVVYTAEIRPPKRVLAPGESVAINEALVPVPKAAVKVEFGWKPGS